MHWVLSYRLFSVSITELSQKRCFGWECYWKPKKQANKNGSTLKKNSNINFSTKSWGEKEELAE